MTEPTYRKRPDGNVEVEAPGTCGREFPPCILIVEPESENPGIQIISSSGIVGSSLLLQVVTDVKLGRHLDPNKPIPCVRVRWGSESTRRENPELEEGDLYEFPTWAAANAFAEALGDAHDWTEWDVEVIYDPPLGE